MSQEVRVRFAPSPTGYLHVGGARTAIFNWLFAKANNGKFILRVEDTDRTRYNEEALHDLIRDLKWLGLNWDEGPEVGGEYGPYFQSERLEKYQALAQELIDNDKAYPCFCSAERLEALREEQAKTKEFTGYDGHCRNLSKEEAQAKIDAGEPYVIRLKTPASGETEFKDYLRGMIRYQNDTLDDLVLLKRDGFPTYHLANVIDDYHMKITHVMRGDEWIPSTPKHVLIYQAFGWEQPVFCHLPVILSSSGGKLSKRKGAVSVGEYETAGNLSEALLNFLSLLGWNPGNDQEILSVEELINAFTLEKVSTKSAVFDEKKLEWINGQYINNIDASKLLEHFKALYSKENIDISVHSDDALVKVIELCKEGCKAIPDLFPRSLYIFQAPDEYDAKARKKAWKAGADEVMEKLVDQLNALADFSEAAIEKVFHDLVEALEVGFGKVMMPARLAVTGLGSGPNLYTIMEIIGKEESINRIQKGIALIKEQADA